VAADFFDVVRAQRACRSFRPEPVPDEVVEQLLEAATHAPSAENRQPWVFVVVRDDRQRAELGELTRRAWEGGGRRHSEPRLAPGLLADVDHGATGGVAAAPVVVVVCGDTEAVSPTVLEASVYPAVQNLLLAAGALGLGSALTTLPLAFGADMARVLGLPEALRPMAVVPIGPPARPLGTPRRRPVSEVAHRERFGAGW
jgi:nitroreductase